MTNEKAEKTISLYKEIAFLQIEIKKIQTMLHKYYTNHNSGIEVHFAYCSERMLSVEDVNYQPNCERKLTKKLMQLALKEYNSRLKYLKNKLKEM